MKFCDNPYGGVVISPPSAGFYCSNSSFNLCNAFYQNKSIFSSGNNSFYDDTFTFCSDDVYGGALYFSESASANILRCKFLDCSAEKHGGAVCSMDTSGFFFADESLVQNCSCSDEAAGWFLRNISEITVFRCNFSSCTSGSKAFIYPSGLESGYHVLTSCLFEKGNVSSHAGVTQIWHISSSLIFSNCMFQHCYSNYASSGIVFGDLKAEHIPVVQLQFCFFQNNSAKIFSGQDIHISTSQQWTELIDTNFSTCYSLTVGARAIRCKNRGLSYSCDEYEIHNDWLKDIPLDYQIRAQFDAGIDTHSCGNAPLCQTLKHSITRTSISTNKTIYAQDCTFLEELINVGSSSVSIKGESRSGTAIRSVSGNMSVFAISSGSLELNMLKLLHMNPLIGSASEFVELSGNGALSLIECNIGSYDPEEIISNSMFLLNGGNTQMNQVNIESIKLSSSSVINLANAKSSFFSFFNCNALHISRTRGNGTVFSGNIAESCKVELGACCFKNCICFDGCGGALSVTIASSGMFCLNGTTVTQFMLCSALNEHDQNKGRGGGLSIYVCDDGDGLNLSKLEFSKCNATKGKNMFINGYDLSLIVTTEKMKCLENEEGYDEWIGVERNSTSDSIFIPLIIFLRNFSSPAYVSIIDGSDFRLCGFLDYPCLSIQKAAINRYLRSKREICVFDSHVWNEHLTLTDFEWNIRALSEKTKAFVENCGEAMESEQILVCISTNIENYLFILPQALGTASSFISCVESNLVFHKCEVSCKSTNEQYSANFCFVRCSGGTLTLDAFCVENRITFQTNSLIYCKEGCRLSCIDCSFVGIERASGNGACIEARLNENNEESNLIVIENCSFTNCKVLGKSNCGGGIYASRNNMEKLAINGSTSFGGCYAPHSASESGKGGGIMIELTGDSSSLEIKQNVSFPKENQNIAFCGNDIFLLCDELNITVTRSAFALVLFDENQQPIVDMKGTDRDKFSGIYIDLILFLVTFSSDKVFIGSAGFDILGCGKIDFPCGTFLCGFDKVQNNASEKGLIIAQSSAVVNSYDLSDFSLNSSTENMKAILKFENLIENESSNSVITSSCKLTLDMIVISIPENFSPSFANLFSVSTMNGLLTISNCSFVAQSSNTVEFNLLFSDSGTVIIDSCIITHLNFQIAPIQLFSVTDITNCTIDHISSGGTDGGVLCILLKSNQKVKLSESTVDRCECTEKGSRGGFLFLDCSKSDENEPFLLANCFFGPSCSANVGEIFFVLAADLNASVNPLTFKVDGTSFIDDNISFCGSDSIHKNTSLFRFSVKYEDSTIWVKQSGFDIRGCGKENDPCYSFFECLRHFHSQQDQQKKIRIIDKASFGNRLDLSGIAVQASSVGQKEVTMATLDVVNGIDATTTTLMINTETLLLERLRIVTDKQFSNSEKTVLLNENGEVTVQNCMFSPEERADIQNDCSLIYMKSGKLNIEELEVLNASINIHILQIENKCDAFINGLRIESVIVRQSSLIAISYSSPANANETPSIQINGSEFANIESLCGCPCISSIDQSSTFSLIANRTIFRSSKSATSVEGGLILFPLNVESSFKMIDSSVIQCSCSLNHGKGGGLFLRSRLTDELNFKFFDDSFDGNMAQYGRNVFIECYSIDSQINGLQFKLDLNSYTQEHLFSGIDSTNHTVETDLLQFMKTYQSSTIFVSNLAEINGNDNKQCGSLAFPCKTVDYALKHILFDFESRLIVDKSSVVESCVVLSNITLKSKSRSNAVIMLNVLQRSEEESQIICEDSIDIESISFEFYVPLHPVYKTLFDVINGTLLMKACSISDKNNANEFLVQKVIRLKNCNYNIENSSFEALAIGALIKSEDSELSIIQVTVREISCNDHFINSANTIIYAKEFDILFVVLKSGCFLYSNCSENEPSEMNRDHSVELSHSSFVNISCNSSTISAVVCLENSSSDCTLMNCTFDDCFSKCSLGSVFSSYSTSNLVVQSCSFAGRSNDFFKNEVENDEREEICIWNGSLLSLSESVVLIKDTTISNSSIGGLSIIGGIVKIDMGLFSNNAPQLKNYPSLRRNILCSGSAKLNVASLKGGDGMKDNASLWILNEGCYMEGIAANRSSSFFIPLLKTVEVNEGESEIKLRFKGTFLLPCNLSFIINSTTGSTSLLETREFAYSNCVSENEVVSSIPLSWIRSASNETEVSVCVLFGSKNDQSPTESIILKNRTKSIINDELAQGSSGSNKSWLMIMLIVFAMLFFIVLIVSVLLAIRWRKAKERTQELEEIMNDTVRKDPKVLEMTTMEMSPEEQWRRVEREAEKKSEERIKKRVYAKSLGHSESSEHLLSESGSTEYILGKDSDNIPDWALEKVEKEEEEINKKTPSPSVSSTSATDSDSTFVRGEDLCPTTSSMSNLVDAMACSSPHEKLIVDLRDSLFMLLHGRNKTKEMPIGTLEEREQTAAQILFWVANLALHSFDEMENGLSSLSALSPHIVLFSEHMVICIVMRSDFSYDDDSDSSSISSSTVVTSASDDSDSLPSSAFEDEDDNFKKECLRWKAPELLINKKMGATKKSVVFSIGMMLWECLTLQIPFGDFEAELAGQKIVNGESVGLEKIRESSFYETAKCAMSIEPFERPTLITLKRKFYEHFPSGANIVTVSDVVDFDIDEDEKGSEREEKTIRSRFISDATFYATS